MINRGSLRSGSCRMGNSGSFPGVGSRIGMRGWWEDLTGSINWDPSYSPIFQQYVEPALNVVGISTVGVPVGSVIDAFGGAGSTPAPAPTSPYKPPTPYSAPAPAPTAAKPPTSPWVYAGVAGVVGISLYLALRPQPQPRRN